jgi:hypothetical protein
VVPLELSGIGTVCALRVRTDQPIILNPGANQIIVNSDFLLIPGIIINEIQKIGTVDANIIIIVYGNVV